MKAVIQLFILTLLLLPFGAQASKDIFIESFKIKPNICVVARGNNCQQKIHFQWQLSQAADSCLFRTGQQKPIYCSSMQQSTSIVLAMNVDKENEFFIHVSVFPTIVAFNKLKVRELGRDVRQSRRHLWSVF